MTDPEGTGTVGAPAVAGTPPADLAEARTRLRLRDPANLVSPKAKTLWRLSALLGWSPLAAGLVVWMFVDSVHRGWQLWVLAGTVVVVAVHVTVMPAWRYRVHRWEINDLAVYTQTGWIHQERRLAPISRIQTVDSEFGPLERMFGLGSVRVTTASAAGAQKVSGLEREVVERIVSDLTVTAAASESDAT